MRRPAEPDVASGGTAQRSIRTGVSEPVGMLAEVSLSAGAVVMATGIVSIGLQLDGFETFSRVLLVIAVTVGAVIAIAVAMRSRVDARRLRREARSPAALTLVAASGVVGTRVILLGWNWAGEALLVIALLTWIALLGPVLANWSTPTVGTSLMLTVSTQSLAVLAAAIGAHTHATWLLGAAFALLVLGLLSYAFVMSDFDYRHLLTGQGDHWITGGAVAISALAAGQVAGAHELPGLHDTLRVMTVVLWAVMMAWLPALLIAEALRPRLDYAGRRWATVFPVGMYAACSFHVGAVIAAPAITEFARVWIWFGVAVWLVVAAAMVWRRPSLLRRHTL